MIQFRLLVADGDASAARAKAIASTGQTFSAAYADVLQGLLRRDGLDANIHVAYPADDKACLPEDATLADYDGVVLTGSSLHLWKAEPEALRQVEFARAVFAAGVPFFGSCWGLQVAAVAAGGAVRPNPRGREIGFARNIALTDAGCSHPLHRGKPRSFAAPAVHLDEICTLPGDAIVTASNAMSLVQAAEIRLDNGVFWGVQYHPEYTLSDVVQCLRNFGLRLVTDGFYASAKAMDAHIGEIEALAADASRRDIAWKLGVGEDTLDPSIRLAELANWLARLGRA
jgi:GMP synthase (glutamine-hydrolysing)